MDLEDKPQRQLEALVPLPLIGAINGAQLCDFEFCKYTKRQSTTSVQNASVTPLVTLIS